MLIGDADDDVILGGNPCCDDREYDGNEEEGDLRFIIIEGWADIKAPRRFDPNKTEGAAAA